MNIGSLVAFHKTHGKEVTVSAVVPPGRYGALQMKGDVVQRFVEKPPKDNSYINGGFFVLQPSAIDRNQGRRHSLGRRTSGIVGTRQSTASLLS